MKLRVRGNAVRIRVTRGELDAIAAHGRLFEETRFGTGATLRYGLTVSGLNGELRSSFDGHTLTVTIPEALARAWTKSELVTLTGEQRLPGNEVLSLVVEKDFACLKPREGDDDEDTFAHPHAETGEGC